jgi:hypothetical protein
MRGGRMVPIREEGMSPLQLVDKHGFQLLGKWGAARSTDR